MYKMVIKEDAMRYDQLTSCKERWNKTNIEIIRIEIGRRLTELLLAESAEFLRFLKSNQAKIDRARYLGFIGVTSVEWTTMKRNLDNTHTISLCLTSKFNRNLTENERLDIEFGYSMLYSML